MVPVLNREVMLAEALDSILAQTDEDWECVVVESGSADRTWEVCRRFAALDKRFRIFHETEARGYTQGVLSCIREAQGDFGKLLFSDDLIAPTYLEKTLPWLTEDVGFVYTPALIGTEPWEGVVNYQHETGRYPGSRFVEASLVPDYAYPVSPGCAIFHMDAIRRYQLAHEPHPYSGTDLLLFMRTANAYPYFAHVAEPLSWFRTHPGSMTIARFDYAAEGYEAAREWWRQGNR